MTNAKPDKAFPSLVKCYKENKDSCCNAAQDAFIKDQMALFFPDSCQRSFEEMERYFCLGCTSREPGSINRTITYDNNGNIINLEKAVLICASFAA